MQINLDDYDFIDFGASKGGSIEFGKNLFDARRGIGIDLDPDKVALMRGHGYDCIEGDITQIDLPENSVRFVMMSHILEHLPGLSAVRAAIANAARVATDFLFIQGPFFDADLDLAADGLKLYWSDWTGHTCHLRSSDLERILEQLGLDQHQMHFATLISSSRDEAIHPLASPRNQHQYDPARHPEKSVSRFRYPVYREIVCCVRLRDVPGWERLVQRVRVKKKAVASAPRTRPTSGEAPAPSRLEFRCSSLPQRRRLTEVHKRLMFHRRWSYLRYLHLREAFLLTRDVKSALSVNSGQGYAELALALEFPEVQFRFEWDGPGDAPAWDPGRKLVETWGVSNLSFARHDLDSIAPATYDLVCSIETIARAENDREAAAALRRIARRYVFILAPFADPETNASERLRERLRKQHAQHRVGYDLDTLSDLLERPLCVRGCYWSDFGGQLREKLAMLSDAEVRASLPLLQEEANRDLVEEIPLLYPLAFGIWGLAELGPEAS